MTYDAWYTLYLDLYKRQLAPRTRDGYDALHRQHIVPALGGLELAAITPEDVQGVLLDAASRSGSRTAQAVYALLRAVFRRAVRSRRVQWSPVDAVDRPQHVQQTGRALSDADYAAALPWVVEDVGLSLALLAGLRRGEIVGLQWGDVDLPGRSLHIRRTRQRIGGQLIEQPTKSAAGVRVVPISRELLPVLRAAYRFKPSAWVVDVSPETISRRWRQLQKNVLSLSQPYRLHDLRHTYVTRLMLAGAVPRVVQYLAGHADLSTTTRIYSHVTPDDAQRELKRVSTSYGA